MNDSTLKQPSETTPANQQLPAPAPTPVTSQGLDPRHAKQLEDFLARQRSALGFT